jgi:hypothetical protein
MQHTARFRFLDTFAEYQYLKACESLSMISYRLDHRKEMLYCTYLKGDRGNAQNQGERHSHQDTARKIVQKSNCGGRAEDKILKRKGVVW